MRFLTSLARSICWTVESNTHVDKTTTRVVESNNFTRIILSDGGYYRTYGKTLLCCFISSAESHLCQESWRKNCVNTLITYEVIHSSLVWAVNGQSLE